MLTPAFPRGGVVAAAVNRFDVLPSTTLAAHSPKGYRCLRKHMTIPTVLHEKTTFSLMVPQGVLTYGLPRDGPSFQRKASPSPYLHHPRRQQLPQLYPTRAVPQRPVERAEE